MLTTTDKKKLYIETYGCQQNEADSERLVGLCGQIGFETTQDPAQADLILINTCAVREHAELKALSNTGRFKHLKAQKPQLKIGVCGCMVQQEQRTQDLKLKYPYVDFVFGTNMFEKVQDIIKRAFSGARRQFRVDSYEENPGTVCEGLPITRRYSYKAYVSIMSGCNNFCSYCVVPYVRGRERSRQPQKVLEEIRQLVANGCKEITLLGQNVNSYGKDLGIQEGFSKLLKEINALDGDFLIRFMTSHPKDASDELIQTLSECSKCAPHFHLPLQAGSDRILKEMNRKYTRTSFRTLVDKLRVAVPGIAITSDIIVGFPGETEADFQDTLNALSDIKFDNVFSFVYSPRKNTPAAARADQIPDEEKKKRMGRLLDLQQEICLEKNRQYEGKRLAVLCEGPSKNDPSMLSGRTASGKLVHFAAPNQMDLLGQRVTVKIVQATPILLIAEI